MSENTKIFDENELEVQNMIRNQIREEFLLNLEWIDIDDFPEEKIIKTKKIPTFDELFEKIAESGIESLSQEELLTLNQYSK
jgi:predicted RNA-binding protein with PUA domain